MAIEAYGWVMCYFVNLPVVLLCRLALWSSNADDTHKHWANEKSNLITESIKLTKQKNFMPMKKSEV